MTLPRVGSCVLAIALALAATGCTPTLTVQHFRIYDVQSVPFEAHVRLTDQLDPAAKDAKLTVLTHFANPSRKVHSGHTAGVDRPDEHFDVYALDQPQPEPRRTVRFRNQFGQHSVDIREPLSLLVPAQKTSHPGSSFPDDLDHYKCYRIVAINTAPSLPVVTLGDQFGSHSGVQVKDPVLFCIPVKKEREGEPPKEIIKSFDHLAIYDLPPMAVPQQITTRDQFGDRPLSVLRSVMLAVPTEKQVVVAHP